MKRIGVLVGLVAVVAVMMWWRCGGRREPRDGARAPASAGKHGSAIDGAAAARVDPRTLQRGSIGGIVTDAATKRPLANARVCADGWSNDAPSDVFAEPSCALTDAAGAYTIEKLLAAEYTVSAAANTYRPAFHHAKKHKDSFRLAAGEAKRGVDIALEPGGVEITGTVSDITGGPVGNARVRAAGDRFRGSYGPPVETDAQGQYAIWVRPGGTRVIASADGYADATAYDVAPGTIDLLLTPESSLTGIVVDAKTGAPVEGARVSVDNSGYGWDAKSDRTDAQGKFRVHGLTPGRYVAEAKTERGYGRSEGSTLVGLGQHVDDVVVKLHPALRIQGKVMIEGEPAVACEDGTAWFRDEEHDRWVTGRTDPDGTITAEGVIPGTYSVMASCRGYALVKDKLDSVTLTDHDVLGLVWEVEPGGAIKGKVVTKQGAAIADASVYCRTTGGGARDQQRWGNDESKADGAYELTGLRAGTYRVETSTSQAIAPREGFTVDVPAGKVVEKDLVLDDAGTIVGMIVDGDGKPVAGAKADARSVQNDWDFRWDSGGKSDASGKFKVTGLRAGEYRVVASKSFGDTLRKPGETDDEQHPGEKATVRAGETTSVRLVVEAQSGIIKGTVVDADGKPIGDAYLSAARESDAAGAQQSNVGGTRGWDWGDEKPTLTNVDGTFAITKLSPGKYTVRAYRKGGGEAVQEHVAIGSSTRLQLKHTGSLAGIAKRAGNGPAPEELGITVSDLKTGFERTERFYKTGGAFTIRDLPKGHFTVTAGADGGSKKIELDLAEGETKTGVTLELDALVTITGRIVEHGTTKPVAGMRVFAQLATGGGGFSISFGADGDNDNISDETGRFTVKRVSRGQIAIQGMAKEWKDSDYTWFRTLKTIDGTASSVDVGDIGVIKRRVKDGETSGELGINFKQQAPDTPPDKAQYEVSYIDPKGPAANTGIAVGDIITTIDGVDVTGGNAMHGWTLMDAPPGTKLVLGLARGATIAVTLAAP